MAGAVDRWWRDTKRQAFTGVLHIRQIDEGSVSLAGLHRFPSVSFVMMGNGREAKPESQRHKLPLSKVQVASAVSRATCE